jgi:predicted O-linked N-acetylglucosamine transferase (SPINDLY family)
VPASRLLLHAVGGAKGQPSLMARLSDCGLPDGRVEVLGYTSYAAYLTHYHQVDIALDPFPYNGGTTSLDALYMGVPVVTLAGTRPVGRAGVTILSHLGLPELIARTPGKYVETAARLAGDLDALASMRTGLRARLRTSPLMDAVGHTRRLEALYRQMWGEWCSSRDRGGSHR